MKNTLVYRIFGWLAVIVILFAATAPASAFLDKYTINREDLPQEARQFLDQYFPKAKVGMIKVDRHLLKKTDYDVRLTNGTEIEFSNKGKWTSVDCKKRAVPDGIVPKNIARHVSKNYADVDIVSIEKKASHYKVGLSDGVVLKYSLLGQFKGVIEVEDN